MARRDRQPEVQHLVEILHASLAGKKVVKEPTCVKITLPRNVYNFFAVGGRKKGRPKMTAWQRALKALRIGIETEHRLKELIAAHVLQGTHPAQATPAALEQLGREYSFKTVGPKKPKKPRNSKLGHPRRVSTMQRRIDNVSEPGPRAKRNMEKWNLEKLAKQQTRDAKKSRK